jgi:hypothetical protein
MDKLRKEIKSVVKQHLHKKMGSGLMSAYQEESVMGSGYHTGYKKRIGSAKRHSRKHLRMGSAKRHSRKHSRMGSARHRSVSRHSRHLRMGSAHRRSVSRHSRHSRMGSARHRSVSRHSRVGSARLIGLPTPKLYKKVGGVRRHKSRKLHSVKMGSAHLRGARMNLYRKSRVGSAKYAGGKRHKKSSRHHSVKGMALRRKHSVRYM